MQSFILALTLSSLALALPHAQNVHHKLHARASDIGTGLKLHPVHLAGRDVPTTYEKSAIGACGGSSGDSCAPGFCCSQYGYCGQGAEYCGAGGDNSTAPVASAPAYSMPASSAAAAPAYSTTAWGSPAQSSAPAATSAAATTAGAPAPSSSSGAGGPGLGNVYKMYSGNGEPSQGWPSINDWMDFDSMWDANRPTIMISCTEFGAANNNDQETDEIKSAISSVASSSGIDERFILAIMMQESKGCVRVDTTDNGVVNPGLFQSHDGKGTCWPLNGTPTNPCPDSEITQMVQDGVEGTAAGDGLKQVLGQCTDSDEAGKYYQAAAIYNSGNLPQNLDDNTATPCYSSDVANRLTGWTTSATKCTLT